MGNLLILVGILLVIRSLVVCLRNGMRRTKDFQQKISVPGTFITIKVDCTVTEKEPELISKSNCYIDWEEVNPFFKNELTNRGIVFKHLKVKDLGYTWVDKDNKKGYNQYEIEYWNWD